MSRKHRWRIGGPASIEPPFKSISEQNRGSPPGSPIYIGDKEPTEASLSLYVYDRNSWRMACPNSVPELLPLLDEAKINWINVNGLTGGIVEALCQTFGVHPLVLEDILNTEHRPKVETFGDYLFIITKMLTLHEGGRIEYEQVSFLLKKNLVLTIQESPGDCFGQVRERIAAGVGRIRNKGADYLAYGLLDLIFDNYFLVLESIGDRLEEFELGASEGDRSPGFVEGLQDVKRELLRMRRTVWPVRDSVSALLRLEPGLFSAELQPFLRDLHENTVQAIEALETYRENAASILEIHLSSMNNRMSEVMKVLTIISTIFIPLTFISGIYGMNFQHMPELGKPWAYPLVLIIMGVLALGELVYFKIKKWI